MICFYFGKPSFYFICCCASYPYLCLAHNGKNAKETTKSAWINKLVPGVAMRLLKHNLAQSQFNPSINLLILEL